LLVDNTSKLTLTETGFPGATADIVAPVGLSSQFVACPDPNSDCQMTVTNRAAPPPPSDTTVPPPTTPTTPTTVPVVDTSIVPPPPPPSVTIPPTLPATGSSDATPLVLFSIVLVPIGVVLVAITRRRAHLD